MKKILIVSAIALTLFIIATFGYSKARVPAPAAPRANNTPSAPVNSIGNSAVQDAQSDEKGGIEVSIEKVERIGGQTKILVVFNNHVYDLSQLDLKEKATLDGMKPLAYNVDGSQVGGHHVQGELVFAGEKRGTLILPVINDLSFSFEIK